MEPKNKTSATKQPKIVEAHLDIALELIAAGNGYFLMQASGESMLPLIRPGDWLHIRQLRQPPQLGELLVYHRPGGLTVHRLLGRAISPDGEPKYRLQGDHALTPDPTVDAQQVIGSVISVYRSERELRLDTPAWRRIGQMLAVFRSPWMDANPNHAIGGWLQRFRRRLVQQILRVSLRLVR